MAARVLLLVGVVLFTEVTRPLGSAGARVNGIGTRSGGSKSAEAPEAAVAPSRSGSSGDAESGLYLDLRPRGEIYLGRKGVTFSCSGQGEVSWLYNGRAAPPCGSARCSLLSNRSLRVYKKRKVKEGNGGTLTTINNQRNEYRCISHTSYGASMRSAPTNIHYAELAHAFKESPEDLTVQEGEVSRLSCFIESVPFPPNITWIRDGEVIPIDRNDTKYSFISPSVLYIRATKLSDAGSYRCVADNKFLNVSKKSKEAKLTVVLRHGDEAESEPASLFPQTSYTHSPLNGTSLRLACAASGYPTPTTTWIFISKPAGMSLPDDTGTSLPVVILSSNSGLAVIELKNITSANAGVYICSMKNLVNNRTESQNVTVEVLIPPSFVKKPANKNCPNGRTARFECQAQGYPTPRIYWLRNSEDIIINGRRTVYDREFNKVDLAISATVPSDSGIYQCVAVNSAGEIWAASRLQVNTSRNSPAAPTSLKCKARSPVRIFISWEPPKFLPFTNITAYTVHYRPVDGGKEEVSPPEPGNSTSVEITKLLEPYTNYTFYVRLWNNHGASDQSATITCSTNASVPKIAPKIFVNVISSTKLNVTWRPLTRKEAQGIVTEYKLEWRISEHPSVRIRNLPSEVEQYTLSDLTPDEKYDLRILARTVQGWPNISESQLGWVSVKMPLSNDFIETQILIFNSTTVKMKWNIRTELHLGFTSWKIYCKMIDGTAVIADSLQKNITEYMFTNLESNASYNIELCALNFEEKVHCITKSANLKDILINDVPTALEATPISSDSISLTWLSGEINGLNLFEVCFNPVHFLNQTTTCMSVNSTKIIIKNLKPFMLYQFKVKALNNNTDQNYYSETVECYTKEDVPGKVEDIQWFMVNGTKVLVAWKEPNSINGIIQSYVVAYSVDRSEPRSAWSNITVYGNKTSTSLSGLVPGKEYFVVVQASTRAGFGSPSEPIIILPLAKSSGSSSEAPSSLDEQKPLPKIKEDRKLGIILGISISMFCIIICLCSIYVRRKYESLRSLRESAQPLKNRVLTRNGNGCCVNRSSASVSQPAVMTNEIELTVLCPSTPISTNPLSDTKGGHANGIIESCAKEPLLSPWETNGTRKDLRITENPQYKPRENEDPNKSHLQQEAIDMNSTQLTTINYDLEGSDESLNNNMDHCVANGTEALSQKIAPTIVPVLEPNG